MDNITDEQIDAEWRDILRKDDSWELLPHRKLVRWALALQPSASAKPLRKDWQKRAIEVGFEYWRASDAHGVECTQAQAVELLEEVLGVEVEIPTPKPVKCQTCDDKGMIGGPSFYAPDEGGEPCPDCSPAAQPVAVPGLREALEGLRDAVDAAGYATEFQRNLARADRALAAAPPPPQEDAGKLVPLTDEDIITGAELFGIHCWGPRAEDFQAGVKWAESWYGIGPEQEGV